MVTFSADNHSFDKEWKERTSKISIPSFERTGIGSSEYHKPKQARYTFNSTFF